MEHHMRASASPDCYERRPQADSQDSPKCSGGPAGIRTLDPRLSSRAVPKACTALCDCVLILARLRARKLLECLA
jgi:hypothetical protein